MGLMGFDCRSPVSVAVPGDAEARAALHLEPVWLEFSPGAARRGQTASRVLLAAAIARDTPPVRGEDCADGPGVEESAPTRAPSSAPSSADGCEMGGAGSVGTIDQEICGPPEKKKSKSGGLRDASGRRPGKKARELYQALVTSLQDMVKQDPLLSLESLPLPKCVQDNDKLRARLVARVEAARPAVW